MQGFGIIFTLPFVYKYRVRLVPVINNLPCLMVSLPLDSDEFSSNKLVQTVKRYKNYIIAAAGVILLLLVVVFTGLWGELKIALQPLDDTSVCPLAKPIAPASFYTDNSTVLSILNSEKFRVSSAGKLLKAVQVDTQIGDAQPDVPDAPELWKKFAKFHTYLAETFPTVFAELEVTYVNTYGIVLFWKGTNPKLKPVMLTAHQDVVPVQSATLDKWTYPPFSGHYDGKFVWGRGASDCKNVLVGIMETLELLVDQKFVPERPILAAFGFDEEASGVRGALSLAQYLEKTFGKDSIFAIVDEGMGLTVDPQTNQIVAQIATGEKGYLDITVSLKAPGGHSSIPPDHTSIGIIGELARDIEADTYTPLLTDANPLLKYYQCLATYAGDKMPKMQRKAILRAGFDKLANFKVLNALTENKYTRYFFQTSQAIDLVSGGAKVNALPEFTTLVVNHRIALESSVKEVSERFTLRVAKLAKKYDVGLTAFGQKIANATDNGEFVIDYFSHTLEPAPVSPSEGKSWDYFTGVIKHVFEDLVFPDLEYPIITAPAIMSANTDTRYYWNLTKNIYRFSPSFSLNPMKDSRVHTVDERVRVDAHLQLVTFFYEYLQALNKSV